MKKYLLKDFNDLKKNNLIYDNYAEKLKKAIRKKKSNKKKNNKIINNKQSIKKKRNTKKKTTNNSNKKTKKKSKNGLQKGGDAFTKSYNDIETKIKKFDTYLTGLINKYPGFKKKKKQLGENIKEKIQALDSIIIQCFIPGVEFKDKEMKDYYNDLKTLYKNIYYTKYEKSRKQHYVHFFDKKYTTGPSSRIRFRSRNNIEKYNNDLYLYKIGIMRRREYILNKILVKFMKLKHIIIKKLALMKKNLKKEQKPKHTDLTKRFNTIVKNYKEKFNNKEYKEFKSTEINYYVSLLPVNLEIVYLKEKFKWYIYISDFISDKIGWSTSAKKNRLTKRQYIEKLDKGFYKNSYKNTNEYLDSVNNLTESISIQTNIDVSFETYNSFHNIQYLNSKAFSKDMFLFKSVYMFDNEASVSKLDLGQISIVDNSSIYYYNFNKENYETIKTKTLKYIPIPWSDSTVKGLKREMMRLENTNSEGINGNKNIISLKYLYNLLDVPNFILKYILLYYEYLSDYENETKKSTPNVDPNCLYKKLSTTTNSTKEHIQKLKEYTKNITKAMDPETIDNIVAEIEKSIKELEASLVILDTGNNTISDIGNNIDTVTTKFELKKSKFITVSTFKAMIHLYDYEIENLYLDPKSINPMNKQKENWYNLKSVSTFLNIIPTTSLSAKEQEESLIFKTIKYIYIKLIYLLYFIFKIPPKDNYFDTYFVDKKNTDKSFLNIFKKKSDIKDTEETEVFKPTLFFYIYAMIPKDQKTDSFITKEENKTVEKTVEKDTAKVEKNEFDKQEKKNLHKLRYAFLKESGIVRNLISKDVPMAIIYNLYGEYLNKIWDLLFDLEKTMLYLNKEEKFKKYSQKESFSIIKLDKNTYPAIYKDLSVIDINRDKDDDIKGDDNLDTYSIYNLSYKNKLLYRTKEKDAKNEFLKIPTDEVIKKEDKFYTNLINDMNGDDFKNEYIKNLKKQFNYYLNKSTNKTNKTEFTEFCTKLEKNIEQIQTYMKKYFKLINVDNDSDVTDISDIINKKSEFEQIENIKTFMTKNKTIIPNINTFFNIMNNIYTLFTRINKVVLDKFIIYRSKNDAISVFLKNKNYYDFFVHEDGFHKYIKDIMPEEDSNSRAIAYDIQSIFSAGTSDTGFNKTTFNKSFKNTLQDDNLQNLLEMMMKEFKFDTIKKHLEDTRKYYRNLLDDDKYEIYGEEKNKSVKDIYLTQQNLIDDYLENNEEITKLKDKFEIVKKRIKTFFDSVQFKDI